MVVECKSHNTQGDQNEAYLQLARYARGIFSHQIYRLHVFGVAVCGPTVTFVRFDRSGLLHSPDIDLSTSEGADAFVHHMISLLSLSALDFGYDPRYTFEPKPDKSDKRSDTLLALDGYLPRIVSSLLCHRKCCRGRATMASCLAATSPADTQVYFSAAESDLVRRFANQEIAHKKIWRHEERTAEGTTLQRFRGVFGVCQVIAFWDNVHTTKVKYPSRLRYSRAASYFIPTSAMQTTSTVTSASTSTSTHTTTTAESNTESAEVSSKPTGPPSDSSVAQSETESSQSGHSSSATSDMGDTDAPELLKSHTDLLREVRIASDLLMPKGRPLSDAQSALHVAYAMHDTLLGIMAFAEAGLLHCDISAFNILLVNPEVHYQGTNGEWNRPVEGSLGDLTWNSLSSQPLPEEKPGATNMVITDSQMRQGFVDKLKRGPYAVLCDVEHTVNERRSPGEIHRDRTGTPAFISAQLLMDPIGDEPPVGRSFIHDLESLMWVLIWVAAHQSPSEMNAEARKFVRELSQYELDALGRFKVNFIRGYLDVNATISQFGNTWSTKLAPIIQKMAAFFAHFLYPTKTKTKAFGPGNSNDAPSTLDAEFADFDYNEDDDEVQRNLQKHLEYMEQKRWKSFMYFLGLFHYSIRELSQEEHVDLAIV
ncbi:hypothetical protein FRC12_025131 [Ceratobasidium sp. 428]|nr:hypothetical protein FRC12_025131 [Ceratobasidium sp. 428]